jgi:hypothetical protein
MTVEHQHKLIDPDPFTVAALGIAASSFVLQFVTAWRDWNKSPAGKSGTNQGQPTSQQFIELNHIQEQLSGAQSHMKNAIRSIERGSASADMELYDAKVRVSVTSINLEVHHHLQFSQNLGQAYGRIGNLSMFIK